MTRKDRITRQICIFFSKGKRRKETRGDADFPKTELCLRREEDMRGNERNEWKKWQGEADRRQNIRPTQTDKRVERKKRRALNIKEPQRTKEDGESWPVVLWRYYTQSSKAGYLSAAQDSTSSTAFNLFIRSFFASSESWGSTLHRG